MSFPERLLNWCSSPMKIYGSELTFYRFKSVPLPEASSAADKFSPVVLDAQFKQPARLTLRMPQIIKSLQQPSSTYINSDV